MNRLKKHLATWVHSDMPVTGNNSKNVETMKILDFGLVFEI